MGDVFQLVFYSCLCPSIMVIAIPPSDITGNDISSYDIIYKKMGFVKGITIKKQVEYLKALRVETRVG